MTLNRDQFLAAAKLKSKAVPLETLGGETLEIHELTLSARGSLMPDIEAGNHHVIGIKVLQECVPALKGMTAEEIAETINPDVAVEITTAVFKLSGLFEDEKKG